MSDKKRVTILIPSFNEVDNIGLMYETVAKIAAAQTQYDFDFLFVDNDSTDGTQDVIRDIAAKDPNARAIFNARNFGHIRSPYHAMLQVECDAVIFLVSDFQDPPELIPELLAKWEDGYDVVVGVRSDTQCSPTMEMIRRAYYHLVERISEVEVIKNFSGYNLLSRRVIEAMREVEDPYPFTRGILSEIGFKRAQVTYVQRQRVRGITKNNFFTLYDIAMLGITSLSKAPLRLITMTGFVTAIASFAVAITYLIYKLIYWDNFQVGVAPLVIGQFVFNGILLLSLGLLGEYIGFIHTRTLGRPRVVERERLNFGKKESNTLNQQFSAEHS